MPSISVSFCNENVAHFPAHIKYHVCHYVLLCALCVYVLLEGLLGDLINSVTSTCGQDWCFIFKRLERKNTLYFGDVKVTKKMRNAVGFSLIWLKLTQDCFPVDR